MLARVTMSDQFKGVSVVRDPAGAILAALQSTTTMPQELLSGMTTNSLVTFGVRPRFEGQAVAMTIENVGLYPWVLSTRPGGMMTMHNTLAWATAGGWAAPAYKLKWFAGFPPPQFKVTATDGTGAALARKSQTSPKQHEVTIAQGMDAGVVLCGIYAACVLVNEMPQSDHDDYTVGG